jgi:tetratricopeptide (TPR) repeat protein
VTKKKKHAIAPQTKISEGFNRTKKRQVILICLAILIASFVLYGNTLKHDYALDDDIYTRKNVHVQKGFSALKDIFNKGSLHGFSGANDAQYRPVALLNFMAETSFFGLNPHVSHFFNVLFYALTCIVLFLFLRKILNKYPLAVSAAAALLFTFHPIHTEVVANIKSRDEILSFLFGITSFYFLAKYIENEKKNYYWLSVLVFFIAIMSKETSLMFVFIIVLNLYFFSEFTFKKIIKLSIPYFGAIAVYMLIRSSVLSSVTFTEKMIVVNNSLMAAKNAAEMYATNFVMMGKYIWMLIWPYPLSYDYSYQQIPIVNWTSMAAIASAIVYLLLGGYVIWKFKRKDIYAYSILFFMLTLFLASNLVIKIGATFGERFLFAPSLAFCMVLPIVLFRIIKLNPTKYIYAGTFILLFVYSTIVIPRNRVWKNNFELFKSGAVTSPNSVRTNLSLASEYRVKAEVSQEPVIRKQFFDSSIKYFQKGAIIYDKDPEIFYNLGVTYYEMGDKENAIKEYLKAIEKKPDYILALNNLGVIYFERQEYENALKCFSSSLKYDKNNADAYASTGAVYHNKGNYDIALKNYEKAISINPKLIYVYDNLIKIYNTLGNNDRANYYTNLKTSNLN